MRTVAVTVAVKVTATATGPGTDHPETPRLVCVQVDDLNQVPLYSVSLKNTFHTPSVHRFNTFKDFNKLRYLVVPFIKNLK